jgi:hypothetical protein
VNWRLPVGVVSNQVGYAVLTSTGEFVCYCRNQVEPYMCPKPGKHALFSSLLSVSWIRLFAGYCSCFLISLSYNPITHRPPPQSGIINIFLILQPERTVN